MRSTNLNRQEAKTEMVETKCTNNDRININKFRFTNKEKKRR